MAEIISELEVLVTCPDCYSSGFECTCPSYCQRELGCTEQTPCPDCFASLMEAAELAAGCDPTP